MITKACHFCGKDFRFRNAPSDRKAGWGKYCSKECRNKSYVTKIALTCLYCGKVFQTKLSLAEKAKFCSRRCLANYKYYILKIVPSEKLIGTKRTEDERKRISVNNAKYWLGKKRPDISKRLKGYKKPLEVRKKLSEARKGIVPYHLFTKEVQTRIKQNVKRGKDHPSWKGGITSINNRIRKSIKYKNFVRDIKIRDNYTCQLCGARSVKGYPVVLHTDHSPKAFSTIIDTLILRYGVSNLYDEALSFAPLWDTNNARTLCLKCHRATENYGFYAKGTRLTNKKLT